MKKLFFFLLLSQTLHAQHIYDFDYMLEYKNKIDSTKLISNPTYLVNSNANNYFVLIYKKDSLNIDLHFGEMNGKKQPRVFSTVNAMDFIVNKSIFVSCEAIMYASEYPFKYKVKDYYFENLKDTLIENVSYYHYTIKSNRSLKYQKRNNIDQFHYIVDKNSNSFLPYFTHQTVYEKYITDKKLIPNGILKIKYYTNWENKITNKWVLEKITPVKKELIIPEDCD
ncbi:hypothetical protein FLGE108171_03575 [Flavobacterium gelidilacus]|uniref:hypothetical protein n=1 Tax=Flavobacterium gelidilacus TaxID=206041 RepID=UPI00040275BE|nr:hypothetical protein [Flavobacterium gelidilacus]